MLLITDDKPIGKTVTIKNNGVITQSTEDALLKGLNEALGKPSARDGLIKTNKHVYYAGDRVDIEIELPSSLKPFLEKAAQLQLLLYISTGSTVAYPVVADGKFFEGVIDTTVLHPGVYQLGLVLVKPNGDATKVSDWYGGYGALLSTTRLKVSERDSADSEDIDSDGFVEGDADDNGFVDLLIEDHESCNNAVLKGTYSYIVSGLTKHGEYLKDYLEMGLDTFDGEGNMTSVYADNINRATYHTSATYHN